MSFKCGYSTVRTTKRCWVQFDHIFYGCAVSVAGMKGGDSLFVWVGMCMHLPGKKGEEIMKEKHSHKDNNKVATCTQALWL